MLGTVSVLFLFCLTIHPITRPSIHLSAYLYPHFLPSFLNDLPLSPSRPLVNAAELFNIRQWARLLSQKEVESEREEKDGERKGSMEVPDAAGSRESAGKERTSGREDRERL